MLGAPAAIAAYVDYSRYVESKIYADEMPTTFAQWFEVENVLRGDQLTLDADETAAGLANP